MDLGDLTQIVLVGTMALVLSRVGLALARLIERRGSRSPVLPPGAEDRLRGLEEECAGLRHDLAELQERQDFTERALLSGQPPREVATDRPEGRVLTPR